MKEGTKKGILIAVAVVVAILLVFAGAIVVGERNDRLERERIADLKELEYGLEEIRQQNIAECQENAYEKYTADWNGGCELEGLPDGCYLPAWRADEFDAAYERGLDRCIKQYSN